jgi:hypothetical protein
MRLSWLPVGATSASTWWGLPEVTSTGKLANRPASRQSIFHIHWEQRRAICPEGRTNVSWSPAIDNRRTEVI